MAVPLFPPPSSSAFRRSGMACFQVKISVHRTRDFPIIISRTNSRLRF
jgi:hypothetical protein